MGYYVCRRTVLTKCVYVLAALLDKNTGIDPGGSVLADECLLCRKIA